MGISENKVQRSMIEFVFTSEIIHNIYGHMIYTYRAVNTSNFLSFWYNFVYLVWHVFLWKLINGFA